MAEGKATARVQVTLEINPRGGHWGADCTVGQVHEQALREAMSELSFLLAAAKQGFVVKSDGAKLERRINAKVIGKPKVLAVVVERRDMVKVDLPRANGGSCRQRHPRGSEAGTCRCVGPTDCPLAEGGAR